MNAPSQSGASERHPFPGLRPFAYQDHEYFYGREDHIYALYRLIDFSRFIAVVGSSGSGKSSLVRAGLLPFLDTETLEAGGHNWLWREMRPGDAPLQRLTDLLASLSADEGPLLASGRRDHIAAQLRRSSFGISEALAEIKDITGHSVVLVIDQFEELFRYAPAGSGRTGLSGDEVRARDEATQFVQLLLQASQVPSNDIHVMLTMRSDFIGDCARFHGLPEAVCAAQFLVPSLTRDQLDEVIREPVEKAGATIDPQLVERLLNDCGTEMDQLPVLQHCLSRLWEEAGKVSSEIGAAPTTAVEAPTDTDNKHGRHLSLTHYHDVGEFADALSRHADEILKDLPGPTLQLAVEQVFSALSELDKEGRAVRRALSFSQLVAETGVDESAVRQVLDRFRAEDCSFLTPSPYEVRQITGSTRIDVGHEALLRRWEKVSGRGADPGWLRAEQQAGERYHGLLAMAEGDRATLPSHLIDERWAWWTARPRTQQWAERYGGGFARVQRLLQLSQAGQRIKRWAIAAAFALVLGAAGAMFLLWQTAVQAQKATELARTEMDRRRVNALKATRTSIRRLGGFLNDGTLSAEGAKQFLADARDTLEDMANTGGRTQDISEVEMSLLLTVSDVDIAVGNYDDALKLAERVENISQELFNKERGNLAIGHTVFSSKFRIGDELARRKNNEAAEQKYIEAFEIARELASKDSANVDRQHWIAFIRNKIGDLLLSKRNWQAAMDEYGAGLQIAEAIADKYPNDVPTQKNRIAQVLSERGGPGDNVAALAQYREALAIQMQLLDRTPEATITSNIAFTHRRIGGLLRDKPDEAQLEYQDAVRFHRRLYEGDPGNVSWRNGLVTDYMLLGDVQMKKEDWRGASQSYAEAIRFADGLTLKDPNNTAWRRNFALANLKRGDALIDRGNDALVRPEPVVDESSGRIQDALSRYRIAATNFEKLPKEGSARYFNLFDVQIKIGDVLVRQNKYKEAMEAYQSAAATAEQASSTQRVMDWQIRLADAIEQAGEGIAHAAANTTGVYSTAGETGEGALTYYQKALDIIESAAVKVPDNQNLQSRKSRLAEKIGSLTASGEPAAK
jgi:tetratricopeptide (TPR) repeat protein